MRAHWIAALFGGSLALFGWMGLRASLRPPDSWLWVYVRSGCGPSDQALADVWAGSYDARVVVMPLDAESAAIACPLTLTRLTRLRPYLAPLPESWKCDVLRAHATSRYDGLGFADGTTPVYQLSDRTSLGWAETRRDAIIGGAIEAAIE